MEYYLGIDMGTTNVKAALFTADASMAAFWSEPTPIIHPIEGWSEFEPIELWRVLCRCIQKVVKETGASEIVSAGISSLGESGVLTDAGGHPLTNFIAWYDPRAKQEIEELKQKLGKDRIYSITGQTPSDKYGICKLLWIKRHFPEVYAEACHWLSVEDWVLYKLTGNYATDYSIASRTMAFDIGKLQWSEEILGAAGMKGELFPEALPGGTLVGGVTQEAAEQTGLTGGMPVSAGGHDHACAAVAINIFEPGVVLDSMGTAEVSMAAVEEPLLNGEALEKFYSFYPHCGPKLYRVITSNQSCGAAVEWYLNTIGEGGRYRALSSGKSEYDWMAEEAEHNARQGDKVYFLPFLRGSVENNQWKACLWGMDDSHRQGDLIRAVINGICFELKKQVEGYQRLFHQSFDQVRVVGGLANSEFIMKQKSRIQGADIEVPACVQAACCGAALLGAVGAGKQNLKELGQIYRCGRRYPAENAEGLLEEYQSYLKLREGFKELYNRIGEA